MAHLSSRDLHVRRWAVSLLTLLAAATPAAARSLHAQAGGSVEALATVLAAEDARAWDGPALRAALSAPDSVVRRVAALSVGRLGDPRGVALLVTLLVDQDSTVRVSAVFALGLLGDTSAVGPLIARLRTPPAIDGPSAVETVTALARIGGSTAAGFLGAVLQSREPLPLVNRASLVRQIALEAWRLRRMAPVADLLPLTADSDEVIRYGAVYSLVRLRAPSAADRLTSAVHDASPLVRAAAVRGLTRDYADSAGMPPDPLADLAARAADDADAGVRVNALRALGTFHSSRSVGVVVSRLSDPAPNVRVQAAATLADMGGADAVTALQRTLASHDPFGVRSQAMLSLARIDTAAARAALTEWRTGADWRDRAVAAQAAQVMGADLDPFLSDPDQRVVAAALQTWSGDVPKPTPELVDAARAHLGSGDAAVRSIAADVLAAAPSLTDVPALAAAYAAAARDSFPEAAISTLSALAAVASGSDDGRLRVDAAFLNRTSRPENYLLRRWAATAWPAAARRWGPAYPIATGRTLQDYREVVRRYIYGAEDVSRPHVIIEMPDRGNIEIELLGPDAPLTVANFLGLVDRHYFDGNRWHRVVPNFVIQDGDRRGDGWGSPGGAIRDEINRVRYDVPVVGMALSGPDTGAGQWFINLSPQPHLDGIYTVFGRVVGNIGPLLRVTQGDLIRTIRR